MSELPQQFPAEEGWGVLRAPDGATVFCHFSDIVGVTGYVELEKGQRVEFDYRVPGQDGCDASVSTYARPLLRGPARD